jgi:hypothetical protein
MTPLMRNAIIGGAVVLAILLGLQFFASRPATNITPVRGVHGP